MTAEMAAKPENTCEASPRHQHTQAGESTKTATFTPTPGGQHGDRSTCDENAQPTMTP